MLWLSSRSLFCQLPVGAQFFVELLPAFLREEDSRPIEHDPAPCTRDVFGKPMRPLHVEIHIVRSPDDQGRRLERLQPPFNGQRVLVVEGCEETLQVSRALFGPHEWAQVFFNTVVAQLLRVFICWSESLR